MSDGHCSLLVYLNKYTAQKMKFSIKDFFSKFDEIRVNEKLNFLSSDISKVGFLAY